MLWDAFATCVSAVPLGVLGLVGWTGRTARRDGRTAFAFGAALVLLMEAAQIFIRSHAADTGDVLVGWLGVSLGVWLGIRTLSRDTFSGTGADMVSGWAVAALVAWCAVLCAYHWMPYDFTVDGPDIRRRLARMSLVPFAGHHSGSDINAFKDVLVKLGLSMPLGVFASFVPRVRGEASAPIVAGVMVFAALVFGVVEAGQLLLPSRVAGPTDVLIGIAGAGAGLWLGRWFHRSE
jgi:VanZ family protein